MFDNPSKKSPDTLRSARWFAPDDLRSFGHRSRMMQLGLAYIFISHDLHVVQSFADRVLVMKNGEFVEEGSVDTLFTHPREAYTQELVTATPQPKWELA